MRFDIAQTEDVAICLSLRRTVFIEEQGVSEADEIDGCDQEAVHLLARWNGSPVGTARLLIKNGTVKIGRVCVLPDQRGSGLGAALIRAALDVAKDDPGLHRAQLGAQLQAIPFYEKLGFAAYGPVYDDAGIDHRDMEQDL